MDKTAEKRKRQLGIPFGTAMGKLRKLIMFDLAYKAGLCICYKCGNVIDNIEEFTIEHKIPWLDNDPDLFWDLANIGFSHSRCNKSHRNFRKAGPPGTSWCYSCKSFLSDDLFDKRSSRWNGLDHECKKCKSIRVLGSDWYTKK